MILVISEEVENFEKNFEIEGKTDKEELNNSDNITEEQKSEENNAKRN